MWPISVRNQSLPPINDEFGLQYCRDSAAVSAGQEIGLFVHSWNGLEIPKLEVCLCRVAEKDCSVGQISFDIIFSKSSLSKKVLDTFGNDVFSGSQHPAIVRCPRNRAGCWILFIAIVATLLV
jgi:hypothetical protein